MKLWSGVLSPFSAKVRIALAEKGLPCEVLELRWSREWLWGEKPAALLAVSPRAQVPVLLDDDLAVYDSTVICEYLEDRHPQPALMPRDPAGRARCRMWEDDADQALAGPVTTLVQEVFRKPDGAGRDVGRIAEAEAALRAWYARLEAALAERDHLGGAFGLADVAAFVAVAFAASLGVAPGDREPRLAAWLARVADRPAVKKEFEDITAAAAAA